MSKTLVLIPTAAELDAVKSQFDQNDDFVLRRCGFGFVESATMTIQLIQETNPDQILLAGLAGTYDPDQASIGRSYCFEAVSQYGIGCVREKKMVTPGLLGFESETTDSIRLTTFPSFPRLRKLVSVTCSGLFATKDICDLYPDAIAEDMEGYAVARAAEVSGKPITIVRSISNRVGQPFGEWKLEDAFQSLGNALQRFIAEGE